MFFLFEVGLQLGPELFDGGHDGAELRMAVAVDTEDLSSQVEQPGGFSSQVRVVGVDDVVEEIVELELGPNGNRIDGAGVDALEHGDHVVDVATGGEARVRETASTFTAIVEVEPLECPRSRRVGGDKGAESVVHVDHHLACRVVFLWFARNTLAWSPAPRHPRPLLCV